MKPNEQKMGLISVILLGMNTIIGSGIFPLPGQVMDVASQWSLLVYIFVSLIVCSIAWCFAQCAALFDRNGGAYVYAKEAFGDFIGFEIGIMRWAVGVLAWASLVVGFVTALSSIWPEALIDPWRSLLIAGVISLMGGLNLIGVGVFKRLSNILTVAKLVPLILFVSVGFFYCIHPIAAIERWPEWEASAFGSAALIIFYAFGGFETLVVAAGDMKNPQKNLPLAIMSVIGFCSLIYFAIQWIAMGILGEALATSATPVADAAHIIAGESGKWLVTLAMLVSIGGINFAASFITPRSAVALAEDGMMPAWLAFKGRFETPTWAILVTMFFTMAVAFTGSFAQLAAICVISRFAQYISTCLATIILYQRLDGQVSIVKQVLLVIIPLFALTGIGWLLLQASLLQLSWGLGAIFMGIPLYVVQRKKFVPSPKKVGLRLNVG